MTNNAKVGGVLSIVAGAFGVLWLLFFIGMAIVMLFVTNRFGYDYNYYYYESSSPDAFLAVMAGIYIVLGVFFAALGALAIVGGVFALRKRHWGWSLAGAIGGTLLFLPCGIPAVIFVSLGKGEFEANAPPVPPAPVEKIVG
jgi:hypothetical protein